MSLKRFNLRRQQLLERVGKDAVVLIPGGKESPRNGDVHYPFRQDSNFHYLTGFTEPDAFLVIKSTKGKLTTVLFCNEKDPAREQWDGLRLGSQAAVAELGVDKAYGVDELDKEVLALLDGANAIFYPFGHAIDSQVNTWLSILRAEKRQGKEAPSICEDSQPYLNEMRLIKSADEIAIMQKAADISAGAHVRAMKAAQEGMWEYQLEAELAHEFAMQGARQVAYPSIVGSGSNTCILHYTENNRKLKSGDLVLIDAGCDYQGYAADITRTFPVSGRFTDEQKALYEIVLKAQEAAIDLIKPGVTWNEPHDVTVRIITEGLVSLGLLKGKVDRLIKESAYLPFYMHKAGHWLGMDVHDVGDYKIKGEWRAFEPGMVLTVEPGIYIKEGLPNVPKKWQGIGIRIEDDVYVTASGCHVLTQAVPKTINAIESLTS